MLLYLDYISKDATVSSDEICMSKTKAKVKKTTHIPKEPTYVYVSYREKCVDVIEDTLGEDGPYSGYREDVWEFELVKAYGTKPPIGITPYWETVKLIGAYKVPAKVYVLYVRYSTGDTFGHSNGRGTIVNAYVDMKDALKAQKQIEEGKWPGYAAWVGHFERFDSANVEMVEVI